MPIRPPRFPPNQMPPSNPVSVLKQPSHEAALYEVNSGPTFRPMPTPEAGAPPPPGGGGVCCSAIPAVRNAPVPVSTTLDLPFRISPSCVWAPAGSEAMRTALAVTRAVKNTLRACLDMQPPITGWGVAEKYNPGDQQNRGVLDS